MKLGRIGTLVLGLSLLSLPLRAQIFAGTPEAQDDPQSRADRARRSEANDAMQAGDFAKALKLLTPLAEAHPKDAHLIFDYALAEDELDQTSAAEASYRQAIADDAAYLDPRVGLGLLLARNGRAAEAHKEFEAAVAVTDGDKELRARAYRAMARLDATTAPAAARDELLAALKLTPETPDDTVMAAELAAHAGNGQAAAEQEYRRALAARPNDPATTAGLAHVLLQEKKPDEAEAILLKALAEQAGDMVLTAQLAAVYVSEGRTAEALPLVEQMHGSRPADGAISRMLADLYVQSSEYDKAEPLLAALAGQAPQDAGLVDDYADSLMHLGRHAEAERLLQRLVAQPHLFDQLPNGKELLGAAASHLALAASENGDPTECLQALALRDTVLPTSPMTLFLRAISYDKLRRSKEAIAAYKQFLAGANGKFPDQEFQARHRLVALEH